MLQIFEDSILPYLQRRGPDHVGKKEYLAQTARGRIHLALVGTVLHLRGHKTPQPLEDEHGNILLWNGEIFGGIQVDHTNLNLDRDTCVNESSYRKSKISSALIV